MTADLGVADVYLVRRVAVSYETTYIFSCLAIGSCSTASYRGSYKHIRKTAFLALLCASDNTAYELVCGIDYEHILVLFWHYVVDADIADTET